MFLDVNLLLTLSTALVCCTRSINAENINGDKSIRVVTTHGEIQGMREKVIVKFGFGKTVDVDVFWRIPYAKPPEGDLRFKLPVAAEKWNGVLKTNKPPNPCYQVPDNDSMLVDIPPHPMSEDCLYLTIWRPNCLDAKRKMASLVWIHGESFMSGSSTVPVYNGALLAAAECVIVASMNYRLGAFGFLYLGTPDSPGNMGLHDVAMALTWIKNNLDRFEGNPERITIFGHGAGAAIVSLFLVSPSTRGLFYNAILQSGTAFVKSFHQSKNSGLDAAHQLSKHLTCFSRDSAALVQCLQKVSPTKIAKMYDMMAKDFLYPMLPVTDGDFLPKDPMAILMLGDVKRCNIMVGSTKDEGTYVLERTLTTQYSFDQPNAPNLNDEELDKALTQLFTLTYKESFIPHMISTVKLLYNYDNLKNEVVNPSLTLLNNVIRDSTFICPRNILAEVYAILSNDVYVYTFNYARNVTLLPAWAGATHGEELPLVFGTKTHMFPEFSPKDNEVMELMMKMWANFAKFGNPTPYNSKWLRWPKHTRRDPAIAVFTEDGGRKNDRIVDKKVCEFWSTIPADFFTG